MPQNDRRPTGGTAGHLEKVVASKVDVFQIQVQPQKIQQNRIRARVSASDAVLAVYAALAYGVPETWGHA
jgi:hypothetical protein